MEMFLLLQDNLLVNSCSLAQTVITGRMPQSGKLPVLFYSQAKNQVFRPAGATRCTDSGQSLQYRRAPGSAWLCKISRQSV